jgi:hypothetical protein
MIREDDFRTLVETAQLIGFIIDTAPIEREAGGFELVDHQLGIRRLVFKNQHI